MKRPLALATAVVLIGVLSASAMASSGAQYYFRAPSHASKPARHPHATTPGHKAHPDRGAKGKHAPTHRKAAGDRPTR